jgi:hypothetical protein
MSRTHNRDLDNGLFAVSQQHLQAFRSQAPLFREGGQKAPNLYQTHTTARRSPSGLNGYDQKQDRRSRTTWLRLIRLRLHLINADLPLNLNEYDP